MRLTTLKFKNYRAFEGWTEIQLAPITVFYGWNSAGKSSILRLFVWLAQSFEKNAPSPLAFGPRSIFAGQQFRDIVHFNKIGTPLALELVFEEEDYQVSISAACRYIPETESIVVLEGALKAGEEVVYEVNFLVESSESDPMYKISYAGETITTKTGWRGLIPSELLSTSNEIKVKPEHLRLMFGLAESINKTNYLGPHRAPIGVNISIPNSGLLSRVGYEEDAFKGTNVAQILYLEYKRSNGKFTEIKDSFERIFPNRLLSVSQEASIFNIILQPSSRNEGVKFANVGEGMIQALPFVVMTNLNGPHHESIDIVEQPELHLHPGAHGAVMDAFIDAVPRQKSCYLIETHSENVLLRLRTRIVERKITAEQVVGYWVQQSSEGGSSIQKITFQADGETDWWPEGVFSEDYDEVIKLRTAQNTQN